MAAKKKMRDKNGRFVNYSGPGRPSRPVERQYLALLSDKVPLARWDKIVDTLVKCAEGGERWAIELLCKYLLGDQPMSLTAFAVRERLGITPDAELDAEIESQTKSDPLDVDALFNPTTLQRAVNALTAEDEESGNGIDQDEGEIDE